MNNAVNVGVCGKDLVEGRWVGDISLHELRLLAGDQLNAVDDLCRRVVQVVGDDNLVASLEQGQGREGPDVARSSKSEPFCQSHVGVAIRGCLLFIRLAYPVTRTLPTDIVQSIRTNN